MPMLLKSGTAAAMKNLWCPYLMFVELNFLQNYSNNVGLFMDLTWFMFESQFFPADNCSVTVNNKKYY